MTRMWAAVVVALAVFLTGQSAFAEKRIALVIGNGAYPNLGALKNPPKDAKLMARTLRSLGFEVIERIDANQKGMTDPSSPPPTDHARVPTVVGGEEGSGGGDGNPRRRISSRA